MRRFLVRAFVLALPLLLAAASARAEETHVTVLHTTDVHGSLLPWDDLAQKPAPRGLARVATAVARARAEGAPVVLLDAGDATSGSPLTAVWNHDHAGAPEPVTMVMNAMGYDAMAVGNHEFDFGPEAVESNKAASKFPWLAANIARSDGSAAFPASVVRELPNGVRVGIVGICTPATAQLDDPSQVKGYTFLAPLDLLQAEVNRLRNGEHCDVVIALAHTGLEKDVRTGEVRRGDAPSENMGWQLANEVRGLDALILGHTHVVVPYANVNSTLVTQAGKGAENLGRLDLTLTRESTLGPWKLVKKWASVVAVGDTIPPDSGVVASLAPYAERTKAALDEVVANAAGPLAAPSGRFADNVLWQTIQRAQIEASGAQVSLAALFDPAQRIEAGPVHVRDLMRLYPYENTLVTLKLTGAELKDALEYSARWLANYTYEDGAPLTDPGLAGFNFDMAYGVYYDVDLSRPVGKRIQNLMFQGAPLSPTQVLTVVVNGYRAAGGGDFTMLRRAPRVGTVSMHAPEALLAYARHARTLSPAFDASWSLVPDYVGTPERPLIDRLVRLGAVPASEVAHLVPDEPARRVDLAYWLGRAFDWRAKRPSGAFGDVGDSLEPWVDGIMAKGVLGPEARGEHFQPFQHATLLNALDWAERAARGAGFAFDSRKEGDLAYWRGLVTGVSVSGRAGRGGLPFDSPLSRAQWLGMVSNLRYPTVRVLETTDFHGQIMANGKERRTNRPTGGTPGLAAAIEALRAENPEGTVLLDGGDMFQGTMISNLQYGRPVIEQMNLMNYTAAAIGNHDFDWTVDTLRARISGMKFAALGANIVERKSGKRPVWARSDTTVTRRGVQVGILGLAYPGTPRVTLPANVSMLTFADDSATAAVAVPRLRKAGASVVVAVGHIPAETDSTRRAKGDVARLANGVPGVDAWLGGHSHNVVDDVIKGSPVMIAGAHGQWLAVADLTVDPLKHQVVEARHRISTVYADVPVDSAWIGRVNNWNARIGSIAAEVLGRNEVALNRSRPESTVGDFICDAMRFTTGCDIAMQNPGGVRADLPAGEITRGAIYEIMPFDNTIVTLEITGAEVKRAIEQALKYDRITQVSGVRYTVDSKQPAMSRVTAITLADGSPLDDAKVYKVAVNNFMSTGGDNYDALGGGRNRNDTGMVIRGAMEAYVREKCKAGGSLKMVADGRIQQAGR